MDIQKATRIALTTGQFITREAEEFKPYRILPTNSDDCFVVHIAKEYINQMGEKYIPGKRWNPKVEDILANDWTVKSL